MRTSPSTAAAEMKEMSCLPSESLRSVESSGTRYPHLYCLPLNEGWEGGDPGSTPFGHSAALHTPELSWVSPAFPPGAQSLFQAVT